MAEREVDQRAEQLARGSETASIAAVLAQERDELLDRWLRATRAQPFHAGRPSRAVSDHIPALFDALVALLGRNAGSAAPMADPAIERAAQAHARARFRQGLAASDIVTEFRLLRQEIGGVLRTRLPPTASTPDLVGAQLIVHDALDGASAVGLSLLSREVEEVREDVLATTLHDIQQPVTAIRGNIQLALRNLRASNPDRAHIAELLRRAEGETDRIVSLLGALNEISRLALGRLEVRPGPVDLMPLIQAQLDRFDPATRARIAVVSEPELDTRGNWDALLVDRVLSNLLSNAIKYSTAPMPITIGLAGDVRQLHLWVRDQGIGLAPDELGELFRRYGRGRSARASGIGGLGLGLYLSHGFVAGHGGRMWAESDGPGRGATVHVLLPRYTGAALSGD
ncbi:MAG: sensor histidine kinase [Chloroflexi bacterium]|nr:sensor histidine kinase [Chloroflexota bacterium]